MDNSTFTLSLTVAVPSVCDAEASEYSRATILAEVATVLRDTDAHITNIESAIDAAGIPLQQIHAKFGGTRELILAMASQLSDSMSAPLAIGSANATLRQRLIEFGRSVAVSYGNPYWRALHRIAVTESIRRTGLGRDFYEAGPGRLTQRLADFLRSAQADGALGSADAQLLASHFLSPLREILDAADASSHDLTTRSLADLFCRGIRGGRESC